MAWSINKKWWKVGRFRTIVVLMFLFSATLAAAQDRYIVYFTDKNASPYTITEPGNYLSPRAIARRIKQEILVTDADLPVNPSYVQQLNSAGAKVFYTSRWFNCALVQTTSAIANSLSLLSFVKEVEFVAPGTRLSPARVRSSKRRQQPGGAEATRAQLQMVGIDEMQGDDIYGKGIHVAVLDAGFDGVDTAGPFKHLFDDNRVVQVHDFVENTKDVYRYDDHGTEVFSVMAANSDTYTGGAHEASFYLYVTEDVPTEYRVEEFNWLFAVERADSAGVDVITSSLGYNLFDNNSMNYSKAVDLNGKVAIISRAAAAALARGIAVVCSAGNEGTNSWRTITPPADVDGILAVGSVTSSGARSTFSSVGPTSDSRIKPDVVAMGSGVSVIRPNGTNGFASGTSLAAPIVTSLVIGLMQRFPDIDPGVIIETIIATASRSGSPDNFLGYGIPSYAAVKADLEGLLPTEDISVYPNPTDTGKFSIRFKTLGVKATIIVYDLMGKILSTHVVDIKSDNNPLVINVADLPASSYLVKVKTTDNFKTFRLIKL
jgi:subtilisin family serine protease